MSITTIENLVRKLDPEWFRQKQEAFKNEVFYSSEEGKIYEVLLESSTGFDYETGENFDTSYDIEINLDISKYCWSDSFPYSNGDNEHYEKPLPVNGSYISSRILSVIADLLDDIKEEKDSTATMHKCIMAVIDVVSNTIDALGTDKNDHLYADSLNYFFQRFRQEVTRQYRNIKQRYNLLTNYESHLDFALNQEELGALLFILDKAGVFQVKGAGDRKYLNFCQNHFYFSNQLAATHTRAKGVRGRFNEAKNEAHYPARDRVKQMLANALREL